MAAGALVRRAAGVCGAAEVSPAAARGAASFLPHLSLGLCRLICLSLLSKHKLIERLQLIPFGVCFRKSERRRENRPPLKVVGGAGRKEAEK
ncbi:unnamed protein product [Rangifer tarandus platyrhynchus]|uniref:Uncharacterized protein n=1 Tax=Rangifer tarandus platyrhynchus TaxID=3082113 RepID=A0AC59Z2T5_RANTA